jgi:hypothetical protein
MTRFTCSAGQVYLGTARLSPETVRDLLALFNRERAWVLVDDLTEAADEAGVRVFELEEA